MTSWRRPRRDWWLIINGTPRRIGCSVYTQWGPLCTKHEIFPAAVHFNWTYSMRYIQKVVFLKSLLFSCCNFHLWHSYCKIYFQWTEDKVLCFHQVSRTPDTRVLWGREDPQGGSRGWISRQWPPVWGPHLVVEVVERRFVFREMAQVAFGEVPHAQLVPESKNNKYAIFKYQYMHRHARARPFIIPNANTTCCVHTSYQINAHQREYTFIRLETSQSPMVASVLWVLMHPTLSSTASELRCSLAYQLSQMTWSPRENVDFV